ncbi:helix-turn-helix domain-containing protein [Subtercola vilae]|uniref:Helix-turn-helix domain-containing protein n=1 Tax=Subtercola vilae TaxID=2056433 RepID=A0A4T2C3F6_9MICO|nr:helix-turn-helix domain-containing protein [Subtercola vilae]TIH36648.1 helix-turn-helix domain-containing protein [Subtercola vilae]
MTTQVEAAPVTDAMPAPTWNTLTHASGLVSHEHLAPFLEMVAPAQSSFSATIIRSTLGNVRLFTMTASEHRAVRSTELLLADDRDVVTLSYTRSGTFGVRQDGRSSLAETGRLVFLRSAATYSYATTGNVELVVVSISRRLLRGISSAALARVTARTLPRSALTDSFVTTLDTLTRTVVAPAPAELVTLERFVIRLVGEVFDESIRDSAGSAASDHDLRSAARVQIALHATEPDYGSVDVAAAIGVIPRRLHRLFASAEFGVAEQILNTRLERIARQISDPNDSATNLEIAESFGFHGLDQCVRAFKKRYGQTLREYRISSRL